MAKLTCIKGNNEGDEFAVHEGKNIIGRSQECEIMLFDRKCSRKHCQVIKKGDHFCIQDLDSRNGTHINGKPVGLKAKTCDLGDLIRIGGTSLRLSAKPVGNFINQAATEAVADLQNGKYSDLLSSTSRNMRQASGNTPKGLKRFLPTIFSRKKQ